MRHRASPAAHGKNKTATDTRALIRGRGCPYCRCRSQDSSCDGRGRGRCRQRRVCSNGLQPRGTRFFFFSDGGKLCFPDWPTIAEQEHKPLVQDPLTTIPACNVSTHVTWAVITRGLEQKKSMPCPGSWRRFPTATKVPPRRHLGEATIATFHEKYSQTIRAVTPKKVILGNRHHGRERCHAAAGAARDGSQQGPGSAEAAAGRHRRHLVQASAHRQGQALCDGLLRDRVAAFL